MERPLIKTLFNRAQRTGAPLIWAAGAGALSLVLAATFPSLVLRFFCAPSAWLASQFFGAQWVPVADGFHLPLSPVPLDVTLACSGTHFCSILLALMLSRAPTPLRPFSLFPLIGSAYLITILANTARIVTSGYVARWAQDALPLALHPGVHLATGIVVFSSFLVVGLATVDFASGNAHPTRRKNHGTAPASEPLAS